MKELVFMLEELSAKVFLDSLLPRLLPANISFRTISHHGKSDLQASLPKKLRAWRNPEARFIVLHDQDANDCYMLKQHLRGICLAARPDISPPLIRIACRELESWHLGDFNALQLAFPDFKASQVAGRAKYRNIDGLTNAGEELLKLVPHYQKVGGSRALGALVDAKANTSHSFRMFVEGVKTLL